MKRFLRAVARLAFLLLVLAPGGRATAEPMTPELAVLKGSGVHVNRLAFSADGSRLAAAMSGWVDQNGKDVAAPGKTIVWDVDGRRQVCACDQAAADFTYVWMAADGKTLVTADNGASDPNYLNPGYHEWMALIVTGSHGYQQWDATTGKPIGSVMLPQHVGSFSTAAVSVDGRYLAAVYNGAAPGPMSPVVPYVVGEIRVWDLKEQKLKWRLAGESHKGAINWADALAFSPDGTQLAVYRSMGGGGIQGPTRITAPLPGTPAPTAPERREERRDEPFQPLKVLRLAPGTSTPSVTQLDKKGIAVPARLEWPGDGATLIARNGRSFDLCDAATGRSREVFKIPFPAPLVDANEVKPLPPRNAAPSAAAVRGEVGVPAVRNRPGPAQFRNPNAGAAGDDVPEGFGEGQSALSADGSRLAIYIGYLRESNAVAEYRVAVWEVGTRRLIGLVRLPDEPMTKQDVIRRQANGSKGESRWPALALSGDGRRVAASDHEGTVHVYDTARLGGGSAVGGGAGVAPATGPAPAASPQLLAVRKTFDDAVKQARGRLLASFDTAIGELEQAAAADPNARGGAATVDQLKAERSRFEQRGLIPWSQPMWKGTSEYLDALAAAREAVHAAVPDADMPAELRAAVDQQVVARWRHQPGNRLLVFFAGGKFDNRSKENYWSFEGGHLTLKWDNARSPGGVFVTTCDVAADGQSYTGVNQRNGKVSGTYAVEER